jgi:hypothetical protein
MLMAERSAFNVFHSAIRIQHSAISASHLVNGTYFKNPLFTVTVELNSSFNGSSSASSDRS